MGSKAPLGQQGLSSFFLPAQQMGWGQTALWRRVSSELGAMVAFRSYYDTFKRKEGKLPSYRWLL